MLTLPINPPDTPSGLLKYRPEQIINLDQLNDDCLRLIFESCELNVYDLLEIANVCTRFHDVALMVYRTKYDKAERINVAFDSILDTEYFLRTFGPSIGNLTANCYDIECGLISEYCPNIKKLVCHLKEQQTIDDLCTLLPRLDELHVSLCNEQMYLGGWRGTDMQLQKLSIDLKYARDYRLPNGNFPALIELELINVGMTHGEAFFQRTPLLKKLHMISDENMDIRSFYQPLLCRFYLPNTLRTLEFGGSGMFTLIQLLESAIDHEVPLEYLVLREIGNIISVDLIGIICRIKTIERINTSYPLFDTDHIVQILQNLPALVELQISVDEKTYDDIKKYVETANGNILAKKSYAIYITDEEMGENRIHCIDIIIKITKKNGSNRWSATD